MTGMAMIALTWTDVPCWGAIIVGFPLLLVVVLFLDIKASKKKGAAFAAEREHVSDEEFVRRAGGSPDERIYAGIRVIRKALEAMTCIPAPCLHPTDKVVGILSLPWVGVDFVEVVMEIEDELGINIPEKDIEAMFGHMSAEPTLGELGLGMADCLAERSAESA